MVKQSGHAFSYVALIHPSAWLLGRAVLELVMNKTQNYQVKIR